MSNLRFVRCLEKAFDWRAAREWFRGMLSCDVMAAAARQKAAEEAHFEYEPTVGESDATAAVATIHLMRDRVDNLEQVEEAEAKLQAGQVRLVRQQTRFWAQQKLGQKR